MRPINKKAILLIVAIALVSILFIVACGTQDPQPAPQPLPNGETPTPNGETPVDPSTNLETQTVIIYYVNNEYAITGNENLESVLPVEMQVSMGEKSVEERIVEELQTEPQDNALSTELARLTVLSVEREEDTVFVNFSNEGLQGGSLQESLVLSQLIYSLTELEGVDKVQILVDGNKVETLMGHIEVTEPLTR